VIVVPRLQQAAADQIVDVELVAAQARAPKRWLAEQLDVL